MKTFIYQSFKVLLSFIGFMQINAQSIPIDSLTSTINTKQSQSIGLSYHKTTHLLFPSPIIYADLGSDALVAAKVETAEHVLRIKASFVDFKNDSNFSVMTQDGKFYNFNVYYSDYPESFSYDLRNTNDQRSSLTHQIKLNYDDSISPDIIEDLLYYLHQKDDHHIKHIGSKSYGIQLLLKALHVYQDHFIFTLELKNSSNISFNVDFVSFRIVDKKSAKHSAIQEQLLSPLRSNQTVQNIRSQTKESSLFMFNQFTLAQDKILLIDVFEKNGGRHQTIRINNKELVNAQPIVDFNPNNLQN